MAQAGLSQDIVDIFAFIEDDGLRELAAEAFSHRAVFDDVFAALPASLDTAHLDRLRFRQDIYSYSRKDVHITAVVALSEFLSLQTLAQQYDAVFDKKACNAENVSELHIALLDKVPTATVLGLLTFRSLTESMGPAQQAAANALKSAFHAYQFDISRSPVKQVIEDYLKDVTGREEAAAMLSTVQRLLALVSSPPQLPNLYRCGYASAHDITTVPEENFVTIAQQHEITEAAAKRIYSQAIVIDIRNEQAWLAIVQAHNENPVQRPELPTQAVEMLQAVLPAEVTKGSTAAVKPPSSSPEMINLQTLFDELDEMEYDESLTVLSPAAYFVDLLRALKTSPVVPGNSSPSPKLPPSPNLLDKLLERRPDLGDIELSPANTTITMPYVDLANEIMESFIKNIGTTPPGKIVAKNTPATVTSQDCLDRPQNEEIDSVYRDAISKAVYPLTTFPYNQAIDTVRSYMAALKTSRLQLLKHFGSPWRLAQALSLDSLDDARAVARRIEAAEYLGLLREDFEIITKESLYEGHAPQISAVWQCWGYENEVDMLDPSEDGQGLCQVKKSLLPRSNLNFGELLEILKTRFLGKRLVLENSDQKSIFDGHVKALRLVQPTLLESVEFKDRNLTTSLCTDLHAFIRLKHKLGWPTETIDSAIAAVSGLQTTRVTGDVICSLADIKALSDLTSFDILALVPLWRGLETLVESPQATQVMPPLPGENSQLDRKVIDSADASVQALAALAKLHITPEEFIAIANQFSLSKDLSLPTLSDIYRRCLLCRMLKIKVSEYSDWLSIQDSLTDPLRNPSETLQVVRRWKSVCNRDLTLPQLTLMRGREQRPPKGDAVAKSTDENAYRLTLKIIDGQDKFNEFSALSSSEYPTPSDTVKITSSLFVPVDAVLVTQFVECERLCSGSFELERPIDGPTHPTQNVISSANDDQSKVEANEFDDRIEKIVQAVHSGTIQIQRTASFLKLSLQGVIPQVAVDDIKDLVPKDLKWRQFVDRLVTQLHTVPAPLDNFLDADQRALLRKGECPNAPIPIYDSLDAEIWRQKYTNGRRMVLVNALIPCVRRSGTQELIIGTIQMMHPEVEVAMWKFLLEEAIRLNRHLLPTKYRTMSKFADTSPDQRNSCSPPEVSVMTALCTLDHPQLEGSNTPFDGFFLPTATDSYRFGWDPATTPSGPNPSLQLKGIEMSFKADSNMLWTDEVRLATSDMCEIKFNLDMSKLIWATRNARQNMQAKQLVSSKTVALAKHAQQLISKAALVVTKYKMTSSVLHFLFRTSSTVDINRLSLSDLDTFVAFQTLESALVPRDKTDPLIEFFEWTAQADKDRYGTVAQHLASLFDWSTNTTQGLLNARYLNVNEFALVRLLSNVNEVLVFKSIVDFVEQLGLQTIGASDLFKLADFSPVTQTKADFANADTLRTTFISSRRADIFQAYEGLRQRQRTALIQYLLRQKIIQDEEITDADGLFEYFLIDVQMGTTLQTSRIKQAISTVQLFVQRCLFGLEKTTIPVRAVSNRRKMWDWLLKYSVWVAYRKVFLYPESFIDPSLRDDKTELFKTLETKLMQSDLSYSTICDAIMQYIYTANQIADLDVQAYLWDESEKGNGLQKYHLFARTKTAPYIYYYCTMQYKSLYPFWSTWAKIETEIVSHETDYDASILEKSGTYLVPALIDSRLFLFLPQLSLKTDSKRKDIPLPAENDPSKTIVNVVNQLGQIAEQGRFWELRMGWTELLNGKWSAKEVSQDWVKISNPSSIKSYNFAVRKAMDGDAFGVDCWTASAPIGRFEFRGSKLQLATKPTAPPGVSPAARFLRFPYTVQNFEKDPRQRPEGLDVKKKETEVANEDRPSIAGLEEIASIKDEDRVDYMLSYNLSESRPYPSAMVVQVGLTTDIATYAAMPPAENSFMSTTVHLLKHVTSPFLMQKSTSAHDVDEIYGYLSQVDKTSWTDAFGQRFSFVQRFHELARPYALYNWEIGVHAVSLIMERLLAAQQYDTALRMARYVFDPTISGENDKSSQRCWRFPPFSAIEKDASPAKLLRELRPSKNLEEPTSDLVRSWLQDPLNAHATARAAPTVYMKRIVIVYIKILIAAGDEYFRQLTLESMPMAIQRYIEASHVYGPMAQKIPKQGKRQVYTFNALSGGPRSVSAGFDDFSNATLDMELEFPFYTPVEDRGRQPVNRGRDAKPMAFLRTGYFAYPSNPEITDLRRTIDDRLFKIRNGMDINGNVVKLPLFDPPIDPHMLLQNARGGSGLDLSLLLQNLNAPMPNYRFTYIMSKASELCNEVRNLASQCLSAKEKVDGEALAVLRASQESAIHSLVMDVKVAQRTEAETSVSSLQATRAIQESRLSFHLKLLGETKRAVPTPDEKWEDIEQSIAEPTVDDDLVMSPQEAVEMMKADVAMEHSDSAATLERVAAWFRVAPSLGTEVSPFGVGISLSLDLSATASALATIKRLNSAKATEESSRAARKAQLVRQLQERRLQANLAGREIKQIDEQIAAQRCRIEITVKDIAVQRQQIQDAVTVEAWYRSKYTNKELYTWMSNSLQDLSYQTYKMAFDLAKKAETTFKFERGTLADPGISYIAQSGYWDAAHNGLLAAENLSLGLRRLEAAYMDTRGHDFEITRNVSLRQIDAMALVTLREYGVTDFSIPEVLFDMDFPGHYCRRIKSLAVSVPCIVGPYTGMSATLTLLSHSYRVNKNASTGADYARKLEGDDRFHTDRLPIQAIALSTGQQDAGVFELNFRDERYMPFEGAGAISSWRLELPTAVRQFDYQTISDVIIQLRYTSINAGGMLKKAAAEYVQTFVRQSGNPGLSTVFDLKAEFSTEWRMLCSRQAGSGKELSLLLPSLHQRLPFWVRHASTQARKVVLLVSSDGKPATGITAHKISAEKDVQQDLKKGRAVGGWDVYELPFNGVGFDNWKLIFKTSAADVVLPYSRAMLIVGYSVKQ